MKVNLKKILKFVGPGFVSGASGDDPAGIATFSQAGAAFGYAMTWTVLLSVPLMTAIQYISGRIGAATGHGLAANLKANYPNWIVYVLAFLLFAANTINLGADIGAMAAATKLLVPLQPFVFILMYGIGTVLLMALLHYKNYSKYLKWLGLSLLAYVISAFAAGADWTKAAAGTFIPTFSSDPRWISLFVAIYGTNISPYLVFWEPSEEVEKLKEKSESHPALKGKPAQGHKEMRRLRADTIFGMTASQVIGAFIIFTCAATLHQQGHTNVQSAAEAASALKPAAGQLTSLIFAIGIVGTGLLAIPVLAGSAAYAFGEAFGWKVGLSLNPRAGKSFYAIIALSAAIGMALNIFGQNIISFLVASAIINGIVELPVIVMMMLIIQNRKVMGEFVVAWPWLALGWALYGLFLLFITIAGRAKQMGQNVPVAAIGQ